MITWAADKVPSVIVIEKMMDDVIPAVEGKLETQQTYHHSLLCFGAMVRRYVHSEEIQLHQCVRESDKKVHRLNIAARRKYEEFLELRLSSARTDEEKFITLMAINNIGSIAALSQLQKLISTKESTSVRAQAVYSLKPLCFQNRMKVLQTVNPLLLNHNEESEVRAAALVIALYCEPSLTQMHRMLNNEPDRDFKTYAVKLLRNALTLRLKEFNPR